MKQALALLVIVGGLYLNSCGASTPEPALSNPSQSWKIHPTENVSFSAEENSLSVKLSRWEKINLWRVWPLAPNTEIVKISYQIKFVGPWDSNKPQSYWLNLQEPVTYGNYTSGEHYLQPSGSWQPQEIVQMYKNSAPGNEHLPLRELPKELLINIQVGEGVGVLQLKDFRVRELVTKVTAEHR